jgi:DNA-binding transcriptional LysR family regulator
MNRQFNFPLDIVWSVTTIAEAGSLSKASIRLSLSRPALGSYIQWMQSILGFEIFTNEPNGTVPTEIGALFLDQARQSIEANHQIPRIGGYAKGPQPLRLGIPDLYVPELFDGLSADSLTSVFVQGGNSVEIAAGLSDGLIDIGCFFTLKALIAPISLLVVNETEEEFVWLSSKTFAFSPGTPVPLIIHPGNTGDSLMIQTLLEEDIPYRIVFTSADNRARMKAAQQGLGITAFPSRYEHSPLIRAKASFLTKLTPLKVVLCVRRGFDGGIDLLRALSAEFFNKACRPEFKSDHLQ